MKKGILFILIPVTVIVATFFILGSGSSESDKYEVLVEVKLDEFRIEVTTTGELEAKNSVIIPGPVGLRQARIYQVKIEHLVEEGTVVEKGDYIARLDQAELLDKIQKATTDLQQSQSQFTQTRLDTALELREQRDKLINLAFSVEEKEIILQQSKFEPPATIKQNEIELQKAKRARLQAADGYKLRTEKAEAQMMEATAKVTEVRTSLNFLEGLQQEFTILAPEPGMVIYKRSWNGRKIETGSTIEPWDPIIATLPDLSVMVSKTYVNEVDISFIEKGLSANISFDAFPDKKLTGKVIQIANVGEQKPNSDSKVFEVLIEINESDTTMRPGMTTGNTIIADVVPEALIIPLEALHSQGDSLSYVIKKTGLKRIKQQVIIAKTNADEAMITSGLSAGEMIYLSDPGGLEDSEVNLVDKSEPKVEMPSSDSDLDSKDSKSNPNSTAN